MKKEVGQAIAQRDNYLSLAKQEVDPVAKERYLKAARQLEDIIDGSSGDDAVFTPTPETISEYTPYIPKEYEKTVIQGRPGKDGKDAVVDYDKIISTVTKKIKERPEKVVRIEKSLSEEEIKDITENIKKDISYNDLKDKPEIFRPAARDYDFVELKDVPKSYTGKAGKVLKVNTTENGVEFADDVAGTGDVVGPASSTDEAIARFDGLTGKKIQDGAGATLNDAGEINVTGVFIDSDSDNNSSQFSYGYGFNPLESEYFNKKLRIESFLESPFFSAGVARNYLLQTETFGTTWVNTGGTLTSNDVLAPNGSSTADSITAGPDANANIYQTITNNATGYWSAGLWLRSPDGAGTVNLQINSGGTGGGEIGTPKTVNVDAKWRFFAVTQELTAAHTTKTFQITYGTTAISLWGARMNPGQTCNAYRVNTTSALTTATPGIFFNSTPVYATSFNGALSGNANTSTTASRGMNFGNTLSNATDKTDKWMYFGVQTLTYNASYLAGHSWNEEIHLNEMSSNTTKNQANYEKIKLILKGYLAPYANTTEFNAAVPEFSIELSGSDLVITKDDIAAVYYSTSTSSKVIRYYIRLKDDNTHYDIIPISAYGASYGTTSLAVASSLNTFTPVGSAGTIDTLPTPVSGSVVYATDGSLQLGTITTTGNITAPSIKLTTGAGLGKVLTSDADGDATWETPAATVTKATGAELDTGTNDDKFATAKAIKDSHNVPSVAPGTSGNVLTSNGTDWTSAAPAASGDMTLAGVQSVTGAKTFDKDKILMKGTSTGVTTLSTANTSGTSYTITMPAATGTLLLSGGALGTPSSGTLTNCSGLPVSGITASTSTALGVGSVELGHASDTTLSRGAAGFLAVEGKRVPSPASQASGDLLYRGVTEWERLAKGTAGQVLTMNSGATAPEWAAPAASGGTVYKTIKLGTEADGDDNKTFSLTTGSWSDAKYLMVFLNGVLQEEGATADYTVIDTNTIQFVNVVADADKITLRVQQ